MLYAEKMQVERKHCFCEHCFIHFPVHSIRLTEKPSAPSERVGMKCWSRNSIKILSAWGLKFQ